MIRPRSFDIGWVRPRPLTPRRLVAEVSERVDAAGAVRTPLDEAELLAAAAELIERGAEAIAVSFLFSIVFDTDPCEQDMPNNFIVRRRHDGKSGYECRFVLPQRIDQPCLIVLPESQAVPKE